MDSASNRPRILLVNRAIIKWEDKILFVQRSKNDSFGAGKWEVPGGKMDEGQDISNALNREIMEETNLELAEQDNIVYYQSRIIKDGKYAGLLYLEIFGIAKPKTNKVSLSEEHDDFKWLRYDEAFNLNLTNDTREALIALEQKILSK
jgi:8-oxo-dGTP diphosphatase